MNFTTIRRRLRRSLRRVARFDIRASSLRRMLRKLRAGAVVVAQTDTPAISLNRSKRRPRPVFKGLGKWMYDSPLGLPFRLVGALTLSLREALMRRGLRASSARRGVAVILFAAVVVFATTGIFVGRKLASQYRDTRLLAGAQSAAANGDTQNAFLKLYELLGHRPNHVAAHTMLADLMMQARAPQAIIHRQRLAEIFPDDSTRKFVWASTALALGQTASAATALDGVPVRDRRKVEYLRLRANLDTLAGRNAAVEETLRTLLEIKPDDAPARLKLAMMRLQQTRDRDEIATQIRELQALVQIPEVASDAMRALAPALIRAGDRDGAMRVARTLFASPKSNVGDGILLLNTVLLAAPTQVEPTIGELEDRVTTSVTDAFDVCRWLIVHGRPAEADRWLMALAPEVREAPPLLVVRADACIMLKQWERLDALTNGAETWGVFEPQRAAFSARAARELGLGDVARTRWTGAIRIAVDNVAGLKHLRQAAVTWGWLEERVEVDWALIRLEPSMAKELLPPLYAFYRERVDSVGLRRIFEKYLELQPEDAVAKRSLATLYLAGRVQLPRAHELARDAYLANPRAIENLAVYAYSLHLRGDTEEALALMEPHAADFVASPYVGGYYGVILAASNRRSEARPFLQTAAATPLLTEEAQLFNGELAKP